MTTLRVEAGTHNVELTAGDELTFGRDRTCDVCLDPGDVGISRIAGRIAYDGRAWAVINLSRKRALHIVDDSGFTVPLPVVTEGEPNRRIVDQQVLTVLVPGERLTHALGLRLARPPDPALAEASPSDPVSTSSQAPRLTGRQREVLVVLAQGYLRPYPDYDPRPLTYEQVADLLRLKVSTVRKRIGHVREKLISARVPGAEDDLDARRQLCEWLLATRAITPDDLERLQDRMQGALVTQQRNYAPRQAKHGVPFPTTTHPIHDKIIRIAERTARQVAPAIQDRLQDHYGNRWVRAVNQRRHRQRVPRGTPRDYRFWLSILAHDPATRDWVDEGCRTNARNLLQLASNAVHVRTLTPADADLAIDLAGAIGQLFPLGPDQAEPAP